MILPLASVDTPLKLATARFAVLSVNVLRPSENEKESTFEIVTSFRFAANGLASEKLPLTESDVV
jgi:hypothetical protein